MAKQSNTQPSPKSPEPVANSNAGNNTGTWLVLLGILLFTAVLYWPSLRNGFTNWDDDVYVTANENLAFNGENLKALSTKQIAGNFHPLTMWSLAWNRGSDAQKAPDPKPFHQGNLWLHLLNTALVFWFIRRLKAGTLVAGITALFFAIHPMHVESVAWVSGRKDVLFVLFFLAGLISFTYNLEKNKLGLWVLTFALFILSCLSKPAAIVFPLIMWLVQWYLQPETAFQRKTLLGMSPFLLASAVFSYTTVVYQKQIGAVDEQFGFLQRTLFAGYSFFTYLWKMIAPVKLSAFHPAPLANEPLGGGYYAATLGALAVLALMFYAWKRNRELFFGLAFYTINLLLVLGFVKIGSAVMAERYTYLAYTGLFMFLGWSAVRYSEKGGLPRIAAWAVILGLAGYWSVATSRQIPVWHDSETLWTQIVSQYPTEKCLSYRGYNRYLNKKWDKALEDFDKAYALNPKNETTVHIRAICNEKAGKIPEAIKLYQEYDKNFPPQGDVLFQYANLLNNQKRAAEAIPIFERALAINPNHVDSWNNLGNAYFDQKQPEKSEECFTKALAINPKFLPGLNNRGAVRLTLGKYKEAIEDFDQSLAMNQDQPQTSQYRERCVERLRSGKGVVVQGKK